MKRFTLLTLPALLLFSLLVPAAHAQVDFTTSLFVGSPYVWRGEVLSSGWVFQPTITASTHGFYATVFGNIDPEGTGLASGNVRMNEADLTLGYGAAISGIAIGAGYTLYSFPTPGEDEMSFLPTQELFASAGMTTGVVQPSLFVAYDFDGDDEAENPLKGLYAEAKVGVPLDLGGQAYSLGASVGLDSGYILADSETGVSHLALTGTTTLDAGLISLSPMLSFQVSLDETYKNAYGNTFFYGGITVGF